ncbi:hypothetical protein SpCBS45565_g07357 [Spizellomyces sp. 'palustris']|nr:hypothetical protein SpCBS45565_g07357 [Spizellomyces sp. 'palustris']
MAPKSFLAAAFEAAFLYTGYFVTRILTLLHLDVPIRALLLKIQPAPSKSDDIPDINKVILKTLDENDGGIRAEKLWENGPCLVVVIRRPGCLLCREEASNVAKYKEQIQSQGVSLAAVVHERFGAKDFGQKHWSGLPLYFDEKKDMYKILGRGKFNWMGLDGLVSLNAYKALFRARNAGFEGNVKGEGRILGGLFIVSKDGTHYEFAEKEWGEHAPIQGSDGMHLSTK